MFRQRNLLGTIPVLCLTCLTFTLPFSIRMIVSLFKKVPYEIGEAARLYRASCWTTRWLIMMPVTGPAIRAAALLNFIFFWNDSLFMPLEKARTRQRLPEAFGRDKVK